MKRRIRNNSSKIRSLIISIFSRFFFLFILTNKWNFMSFAAMNNPKKIPPPPKRDNTKSVHCCITYYSVNGFNVVIKLLNKTTVEGKNDISYHITILSKKKISENILILAMLYVKFENLTLDFT